MKKTVKRVAQKTRRTPAQGRSAETVAVIVEAAARVLEVRGLDGFNTNAVAERAGVSIGSLYQYFRNKDALLVSLIELQAEPFIRILETIPLDVPFQTALLQLIEASVHQQMQRPELSRLLDFIERQEAFEGPAKRMVDRAQRVLIELLKRTDAPVVDDRPVAALEVLSLIRALTDAAGERREKNRAQLSARIYGAACGYFGIARPL
jgi:AcrR family transcriptional regulator